MEEIENDAKTILIVDDEERMRKLIKDFLKQKNYNTMEAADGEEASHLRCHKGC